MKTHISLNTHFIKQVPFYSQIIVSIFVLTNRLYSIGDIVGRISINLHNVGVGLVIL